MNRENAWLKYDDEQVKQIHEFNEGYKNFISTAKTERECLYEIIRIAEEKGYVDFNKKKDGL